MAYDNIWAPKGVPNGVCCKIPYKGHEISIAMDDSCGVMKDWTRSDIRVFVSEPGKENFGMDISHMFYTSEGQRMLYGDAETLINVFKTIDSFEENGLQVVLVKQDINISTL